MELHEQPQTGEGSLSTHLGSRTGKGVVVCRKLGLEARWPETKVLPRRSILA